jgi:hypothetical protein
MRKLFLSKSSFARKLTHQIFPLPIQHTTLDREVVVRKVKDQLENEFSKTFSEVKGLKRRECAIIYASGHVGVGKTLFGE